MLVKLRTLSSASSARDAVGEIARVTRRDIRYIRISSAEYASALAEAQVPPMYVTLLTHLFREVLDGRNAWVADGVARALGRAPRDFADYVRDTAATDVWSVHGDGEAASAKGAA
jgi:hypothetical protein